MPTIRYGCIKCVFRHGIEKKYLIFEIKKKILISKMTTPTSFVQNYSDFVQKTILEPLSAEAKKKGLEWSVDEMISVLQVPQVKAETPVIAPKKSKIKKADETYTGPRCEYRFKRGKRIGDICNEPVIAGSKYCQHCATNKSVSESTNVKTKVKPKTVENAQEEEPAIAVEILDVDNSLYKENHYGLVIKNIIDESTGKDEDLRVIGIIDNGKIRYKLTPSEVDQATSLKLKVADDAIEKVTSNKANIPKNIGQAQQPASVKAK